MVRKLSWALIAVGHIIAVGFVLVALFSPLPVQADFRILSSSGGEVSNFLAVFARIRQSGERVIIDGPCLSACTLVLSTIPRNRICVTRRAVLGFHAPQLMDQSGRTWRAPTEATRIVTASYPAGVRAWIKKRGGLTQKVIYLRGRELTALYPRCPGLGASPPHQTQPWQIDSRPVRAISSSTRLKNDTEKCIEPLAESET